MMTVYMKTYQSNFPYEREMSKRDDMNADEDAALKLTQKKFPYQIIDFIGSNICTTDFLKNFNPFTRTIKRLFVAIRTSSRT